MIALTSRQRALLLFLSASAYIAWFAGLGDRIEAQDIGAARGPSVTLDARPPLPSVASIIVRDPFSGKPEPPQVRQQRSGSDGAESGMRSQLALSDSRSDAGIVVPDIDARSAPAVASTTLILRATIVGPQPVAYVASGKSMDIVRVGDTLGDRRVAKIELRGIVFNDGTRLDLPDYVPAPSPKRRPAPNGDGLTLRALQQLLSSRASGTTPEGGEVRATPQAAASPAPVSYPTPGPLPTVDTQGLPVGVNPTENPNAPTPYPYPYPYAPRGSH